MKAIKTMLAEYDIYAIGVCHLEHSRVVIGNKTE